MLTDERNGGAEKEWLPHLPKNTWVIIRAKTMGQRIALLRALKKARGKRHDIKLLLSVDAKQAQRLGADGVHYPEQALRRSMPSLPAHLLQTTTVHNIAAKWHAEKRIPAATRFIAPILPTPTHPDAKTMGWFFARRHISLGTAPHYALGGMEYNSLIKARCCGFIGIAGVTLWHDLCVLKIAQPWKC